VRRLGHALCLAGILMPAAALAYHHNACNGAAYTWADDDVEFEVMTCSAPQGSQKADDLIYGMGEWNAVQAMDDMFDQSWTPGVCQARTGNGHNEVGFVSAAAIDGALGLTLRRYSGGCWSWTRRVDIIEADVFINSDAVLEQGNPAACNRKVTGQRTTVLHELGHAIGLNHDDDHMSLMMSTDGEGKYCGSRMVEPHPDDATGGRRLYPDREASRDLAASEFRMTGVNRVSTNSRFGERPLCPGERHQVLWSVANLGTVNERYSVRWYLSTNTRITPFDTPIATNVGAVQNAGHFSTWQRLVTIPRNVRPGTYYLGHLVDYDQQIWERRGGNNYTYMAEQIRVLSADDERCQR